jgi:preprotein translocase subunit SecE
MNAKVEVEGSTPSADKLKLSAALLLVAGAIWGFYFWGEHSLLLRVLGLLAVVIVAGLLALQTGSGRAVADFALESRTEVRKVVWPTRQETLQTTLVVLAMVLVMGIVLWMVDWVLLAIVRAVTG